MLYEAHLIYDDQISALKGDNVVEKSPNTRWYQGPTLFEYLSAVQVYSSESDGNFRFQVQLVNRPNQDFRGLAGVVYSAVLVWVTL